MRDIPPELLQQLTDARDALDSASEADSTAAEAQTAADEAAQTATDSWDAAYTAHSEANEKARATLAAISEWLGQATPPEGNQAEGNEAPAAKNRGTAGQTSRPK